MHSCACTHTKNKKVKLRRQKRQGEERVQKLVLHKLLNGNKLEVHKILKWFNIRPQGSYWIWGHSSVVNYVILINLTVTPVVIISGIEVWKMVNLGVESSVYFKNSNFLTCIYGGSIKSYQWLCLCFLRVITCLSFSWWLNVKRSSAHDILTQDI